MLLKNSNLNADPLAFKPDEKAHHYTDAGVAEAVLTLTQKNLKKLIFSLLPYVGCCLRV